MHFQNYMKLIRYNVKYFDYRICFLVRFQIPITHETLYNGLHEKDKNKNATKCSESLR